MRLHSFDQVLAELDRLEGADRPSLGRILAHCAQSIEYGLEGFPVARAWIFRATIGRLAKWKFLRDGALKHDLDAEIPGAPSVEGTTFSDGVARLREAIARFRAHQGPLAPHFAYGPLSRDEAERLQSMHVADHLSRGLGANRDPGMRA